MVRVTFVYQGDPLTFEVPAGISLMEAAVQNGVEGIDAVCGGACSCATCHVHVNAEWLARLPEKSEDETELLEFAAGVDEESRLSCQIKLSDELDGITVKVPDGQF